MSLGELSVHNFVDQRGNRLFGNLLQAPACCFHGIAHHEDGLFHGGRLRTGVGEVGWVYFNVLALVLCLYVEKASQALAMMSGDEITYYLWQFLFLGKGKSLAHVADDDLRRLYVGEAVVRIDSTLVLCEEGRMAYLAYVVVESACTDQLAVGPQAFRHGGGKVGNLHAVLEGARSLLRHASQKQVVGIG